MEIKNIEIARMINKSGSAISYVKRTNLKEYEILQKGAYAIKHNIRLTPYSDSEIIILVKKHNEDLEKSIVSLVGLMEDDTLNLIKKSCLESYEKGLKE